MQKPKILKHEIIFEKYSKKLIKESIKVGKNKTLDWYYLDMPNSLIIVPLTGDLKLVLVKVYRYNLKKHVLEFPAGSFDKDESDPLKVAERELLEETGFTSVDMHYIGKYYVLPNETNRWVHIVLAKNCSRKQNPKLDNIIEKYFDMSVVLKDFKKEAEKLVKSDSSFKSLEHCFALNLAKNYLEKNKN